MENQIINYFSVFFTIIILILIIRRPYFGIVFTLSSLPVIDLLPDIPFLSSFVILIGVVTILGFIIHKKHNKEKLFKNFGLIHLVSLIFIGWIFISNPEAAWYGYSRNWLLTYVQLWILLLLTGELINSPKKHVIFMAIFAIVSLISAFAALQQGYIGETISTSIRAGGLANQPNATARYFVIAMLFFNYLGSIVESRLLRFLAISGSVITFLGVFFTLSRTGILLLLVAIGLQIIITFQRRKSIKIIFVYLIAYFFLWFLSDEIFLILDTIIPSIQQGSDTVGIRFSLWSAGLQMWLDHIVQGVGIGNFQGYSRYYMTSVPVYYSNLVAHNSYISVLSETGIVGFILFFLILYLGLKNFSKSSKNEDIRITALRKIWLIVFLIMILSGLTKNDQYDKFLWFVIGISVSFYNRTNLTISLNSNNRIKFNR